jgi:hypothetical protein
MKQFLIKLTFFVFIFCIISEIVIRIFHLAPDIPERFEDKYGIQRYKPDQSGYFTKAKKPWNVNKYGWVGVADIKKDTIISIIGDSYIENLMNPIECNQGSILNSLLPNYSYFEAGRSGVTFIEAMEISRILDIEIAPKYQLLYLSESDFYESISEIKMYSDRFQVSVENQKIIASKLQNVDYKKTLYNIKLLYYLYLKYPLFVNKQNKNEVPVINQQNKKFDEVKFNKLFQFCSNNFNLTKLIFVIHPNTDTRIVKIANTYGIKTILLDSSGDPTWEIGENEHHWSCYGHNQVSKQVRDQLINLINN